MVGQNIGNYRIVKLLREGGMGTVYLAQHPGLGRRVAVKVLNPDQVRSEGMAQRFFNEARAANSVGHRGIVEVSDFGVLPSGEPYLVMELLDGESLTERMTRCGRLALAAALDIAGQAAAAVGAAHGKGIIHRDLKPDNLFLIQDPLQPGRELLKILDFGIAKLAQPGASAGDGNTRTGTILGTPRYMSPEQCRDSRDVYHRADIYSLGVILYEMLSGTPPFVSSSWGELAHMHIGVVPPPLRAQAPDVPDRIAEIVHRAMEKDPDARFQSMADFRQALEGTTGSRTLVLAEERAAPADAAEATDTIVTTAPTAIVAPAARAESGATVRFPASAARATRRTTLASAASELQRRPATPRSVGPKVVLLAAGSLAAVLAVVHALAPGRAPEPPPASSQVM